jgi:tRNA G46 methylase TrmB
MRYIDGAVRATHLPKLLGTYERELNHYIEGACALNFPLIVDIGAAEGYYAVGMALRNPKARMIAFEMDTKARAALAEKLRLNHVGNRVEIRGKCEPEDLERALMGESRPFVICDAEG